MRLIIESHGKGFTVRNHGAPGDEWGILCAASSLEEALDFIRSRMAPKDNIGPAFGEVVPVKLDSIPSLRGVSIVTTPGEPIL